MHLTSTFKFLCQIKGSPQQIGGSSQSGGQIGGSSQTGGGQFIGGVGAPGYLSVPGWENCLKNFTPSTADHSQLCLPNSKPNSCNQNSWEQLKDVFQGDCPIKCYVSPNDTPIFNHGLQKFFGASGNQKTCEKGVKQCQRYVGEYLQYYINLHICLSFHLHIYPSISQ